MQYSKFNISFQDDKYMIVVNLISLVMVKFELNKYLSLLEGNFDSKFQPNEIEYLLKMHILTENSDEVNELIERRNEKYFNQSNKNMHITILTTTACNARCYYCYEKGIQPSSMSLETATKLVDYIEANYNGRLVSLNWFGGEPLLNTKVIDYICDSLRYKNIDYFSTMVSNAFLIEENIDAIIQKWNIKRIQITIDGIKKEYNKIKNYIYPENYNSFEKVMGNIDLLLSKKIKVILRINFNPETVEKTIETIDFIYNKFQNHPFLTVYCSNIISKDVKCSNDFKPTDNPFLKLYNALMNYKYIENLEQLNLHPFLLNCSIYKQSSFVIDTDGLIYKCQHAIMNKESEAIGSIFIDKINEEKIKEWNDLSYPYEDCLKCSCLPICQGGCKYRAKYDEKKYVCLPIRNCLKEIIELYYRKKYKGEKL